MKTTRKGQSFGAWIPDEDLQRLTDLLARTKDLPGKVRWAILHVTLRNLIAGLHHHTQHRWIFKIVWWYSGTANPYT